MENQDYELCKSVALEFLGFIEYQIENDNIRVITVKQLADFFVEHLNLKGTVDDFAKFYGKTKTNVSTVIDRKMLSKPERKVLYDFGEFSRAVPDSWRKPE